MPAFADAESGLAFINATKYINSGVGSQVIKIQLPYLLSVQDRQGAQSKKDKILKLDQRLRMLDEKLAEG